jgi:hypothetical protein
LLFEVGDVNCRRVQPSLSEVYYFCLLYSLQEFWVPSHDVRTGGIIHEKIVSVAMVQKAIYTLR